jgi:hypothetical protein
VREVLYPDLYRGIIAWNRTRKRDPWGQQKQSAGPSSEWLDVPGPELRIVSDALWQAAHERIESGRKIYLRANNGRLWGRPMHGTESKYLLTGLAPPR